MGKYLDVARQAEHRVIDVNESRTTAGSSPATSFVSATDCAKSAKSAKSPPEDDPADVQRAEALRLAEAHGWPEVQIGDLGTIPTSATYWRILMRCAHPRTVALATAVLRIRVTEVA